MTTPLYPTFRKRVEDAMMALDKDQVTPWAFLNSGRPFQVKTCDNRLISYQGITFEGSPQTVFWSRYIEPFLEKICLEEISVAVAIAKERGVNGIELLTEIQSLLLSGIAKTYRRMADIDCRLRGQGSPKDICLRSTADEQARMRAFLQEHIDAEKEMWNLAPNNEVSLNHKRVRTLDSAEHIRAATPLYKTLLNWTVVCGLFLFFIGICLVGFVGTTEITFFGAAFKSDNIGIICIALGAALVVSVFRKILYSVVQLGKI